MVRRAAGLTGPAPRSPDAPFWSLVAKALETEARRRLKLISSARHPSNEPRPEELRRTGTARVRALTRGVALKTDLKLTRKTLKVRGGHARWDGVEKDLKVLRNLSRYVAPASHLVLRLPAPLERSDALVTAGRTCVPEQFSGCGVGARVVARPSPERGGTERSAARASKARATPQAGRRRPCQRTLPPLPPGPPVPVAPPLWLLFSSVRLVSPISGAFCPDLPPPEARLALSSCSSAGVVSCGFMVGSPSTGQP